MEIKINFHKKNIWFLLLIAVAALVVAYGTNNPQTFGHSAGEIEVNVDGQPTTLQQAFNQLLSQIPGGQSTGINYSACQWTGWDVTSSGTTPAQQICAYNIVSCQQNYTITKVEANSILCQSLPGTELAGKTRRRYQCCKLL